MHLILKKKLKSVDVVLQYFTFDNARHEIVDFTPFHPSQKLITILSVPTFKPENVLKIFYIFGYKIWTLILFVYMTYSSLNAILIKNKIKRISIAIDYFGILLGQGIKYLRKY